MTLIAALVLSTQPSHPALWFDGRQTLTVPNAPALHITRNLTIEAWVWPSPETGKNSFTYIVSKNYDNTGYGLLTVGREDKRLEATGWAQGLDAFGNLVRIGRWTHLAFVRSNGDARMYVNGKLIRSATGDEPLKDNSLQLCLGSSPFTNGAEPCHWIGGLKEVRVWSVARTPGQIRRGMDRRLSGHESGLAAYFRMDEGKGSVVHDRTGHTPGAALSGNAPTWVRL